MSSCAATSARISSSQTRTGWCFIVCSRKVLAASHTVCMCGSVCRAGTACKRRVCSQAWRGSGPHRSLRVPGQRTGRASAIKAREEQIGIPGPSTDWLARCQQRGRQSEPSSVAPETRCFERESRGDTARANSRRGRDQGNVVAHASNRNIANLTRKTRGSKMGSTDSGLRIFPGSGRGIPWAGTLGRSRDGNGRTSR